MTSKTLADLKVGVTTPPEHIVSTDTPRDLTYHEKSLIHAASGRVEAVKLHRELTHSTLAAAVKAVDNIKYGAS